MGKKIKYLLIGILAAAALTGCAQSKLSDKFDEETVKEEAMKSVELFNERDYQAIIDMGDDRLKESITAEQFAQASDYGGVVMIGDYEDGKIQFTIAFDEDMKLVQFLIK